MNNNQIINRKPGDSMKAGAIVAIVSGLLFSVITLMMGNYANTAMTGTTMQPGNVFYGFSIFVLIVSLLLNIATIILNIMLTR